MNIAQRFTLLVKSSVTSMLDAWEDPERSLHQLILDMEEQLEAAKRATAQAMANEDRLRARITLLRKEVADWEDAARRALGKEREDEAREAMRRAETAARQASRLGEQLAAQEDDSARIRDSVTRMHEQVQEARQRLQVLQARMRQGEARRAMGKVLQGVESVNLYAEFERIGERVEERAAAEDAYLRLDAELSGADLRRRRDAAAIDEAVDERLSRLRKDLAASPDDPAPQQEEGEAVL